ncbi:hypothetical protein TRFO_24236 [Tritrichomonas foetus]|uniref:Uncharacterized protein n=1 Tax=Tritrichomonas foetus TaxID=1144522 RepID=A0A1J4K7N7_9EUKA|nr:hypothetical protein TRFO_24236 [Tritrichomonas foetus]|eukprot:OHT07497.1 hypothetical protein TRFO_24236 [Tritrichomonas foetus]
MENEKSSSTDLGTLISTFRENAEGLRTWNEEVSYIFRDNHNIAKTCADLNDNILSFLGRLLRCDLLTAKFDVVRVETENWKKENSPLRTLVSFLSQEWKNVDKDVNTAINFLIDKGYKVDYIKFRSMMRTFSVDLSVDNTTNSDSNISSTTKKASIEPIPDFYSDLNTIFESNIPDFLYSFLGPVVAIFNTIVYSKNILDSSQIIHNIDHENKLKMKSQKIQILREKEIKRKNDLKNAQKEFEQFDKDLKFENERKNNFKTQIKENKKIISNLNDQISRYSEELITLRQETNEFNQSYQEKEGELNAVNGEISELKQSSPKIVENGLAFYLEAPLSFLGLICMILILLESYTRWWAHIFRKLHPELKQKKEISRWGLKTFIFGMKEFIQLVKERRILESIERSTFSISAACCEFLTTLFRMSCVPFALCGVIHSPISE